MRCPVTKIIWNRFNLWLSTAINLPHLNLQNALLGIITETSNTVINHLMLIFKKTMYDLRTSTFPPSTYVLKMRVVPRNQTNSTITWKNESQSKNYLIQSFLKLNDESVRITLSQLQSKLLLAFWYHLIAHEYDFCWNVTRKRHNLLFEGL